MLDHIYKWKYLNCTEVQYLVTLPLLLSWIYECANIVQFKRLRLSRVVTHFIPIFNVSTENQQQNRTFKSHVSTFVTIVGNLIWGVSIKTDTGNNAVMLAVIVVWMSWAVFGLFSLRHHSMWFRQNSSSPQRYSGKELSFCISHCYKMVFIYLTKQT